MPSGNYFSIFKRRYRHLSPNQQTNWWVVTGLVLLLLFLLLGLWLYSYFKALEKPYYELKGYRVATPATLRQFLREGSHTQRLAELNGFLRQAGVANVISVDNLLRQGTDWLDLGEPAFAIPPREQWQNIVATLKVLRDEVIPSIGPVDIVSAYRTNRYNHKAGGASGSKHKTFCGLDLVPQSNISRTELVEELRALHARLGPESKVGLGIYSGVRFHLDTCGYRSW